MSKRPRRDNRSPEHSHSVRKRRRDNRDLEQDMGCCQSKSKDDHFHDVSEAQRQPNQQKHEEKQPGAKKKAKTYKPECEVCESKTKQIQHLDDTVMRLRQERDHYKMRTEDESAKLRKVEHDAQERIKDSNKRLDEQTLSKEEVRKKLHSLEVELKEVILTLDRCRKDFQKSERHVSDLQRQLGEANDEKSRLLNRLSEMAGAKLSVNNPNLVDISDENRPTKLAERYNELYDNEWTDAFSVLVDNGNNEEQAINKLSSVLLVIYEECREFANQDLKCFNESVLKGFRFEQNSVEVDVLKKQYIDRRKKVYPDLKTELKSKLDDQIKTKCALSDKETKLIKQFLDVAFDVCMLMCIQDPPVVLVKPDKPQSPFDQTMYKHYTTKGGIIEYVVWPAMRLHESGPLLGKGVAQGMDSLAEKTAITESAKTTNGGSQRHMTQNGDTFVKDSEKASIAEHPIKHDTSSKLVDIKPIESDDDKFQQSKQNKSSVVDAGKRQVENSAADGVSSSVERAKALSVDIEVVKTEIEDTKSTVTKSQKKPAPIARDVKSKSENYDNVSTLKTEITTKKTPAVTVIGVTSPQRQQQTKAKAPGIDKISKPRTHSMGKMEPGSSPAIYGAQSTRI